VVYTPVFPGPTSGNYGIPVTYVTDSGYTYNAGDDIVISFARAGDIGSTGFQGETGPQGATGAGFQGATGVQGATGAISLFTVDYQSIPDSDQLFGSAYIQLGLYHSNAHTFPSCNITTIPTSFGTCSFNAYQYTLYECDEGPPLSCGQVIEVHPTGVQCNIIPYQNDLSFCQFKKYFCAITDGFDPNGFAYPQDAYIEWHWATTYNVVGARQFNTNKFVFVASYEHILNQYNANVAAGSTGNPWFAPGGPGTGLPGQFGIPLFNPSNHNP
jgi:hypothetical protein